MRPLFAIFILAIAFTACRKPPKHNYDKYSITLDLSIEENVNIFSWSTVQTDDFISYELYGSTNPISDVASDGTLSEQLIFSTTKSDQSSFKDSTGLSFTFKYYKLIARLENSILSSENVKDIETIFIDKFSSSNSIITLPFPTEKKILIYENFGSSIRASIYDYENEVFTIEDVDLPTLSSSFIKFCIHNNQPALCNLYGNENGVRTLIIYDLENLSVITSYPHPANTTNFSTIFYLKNNYLVFPRSESGYVKLRSWDINSNVITTVDSSLTTSFTYNFARFNPKYVFKYRSNRDSIYFFDVQQNGSLAAAGGIKIPTNSFNGSVTQGQEQFLMLSTSSTTLKNRSWQDEESFLAAPNIFYMTQSANEDYYAYQNNTFGGDQGIYIYKRGQRERLKRLPSFNNFSVRANILDDEHFIFLLNSNNFNQTGLILKKFKLED